MKLTQYSDLGLRLLMYLALRYENTPTIQGSECAVWGVQESHGQDIASTDQIGLD